MAEKTTKVTKTTDKAKDTAKVTTKTQKTTSEVAKVEKKASTASKGTSNVPKGTKNPAVKEAVEYGKKMHKEMDYGKGVKKEVTLPSGKRMDGYDKERKIIYELKPDNPRAVKNGTKQLQGYVDEANKVYGPGHKGVLKTYKK